MRDALAFDGDLCEGEINPSFRREAQFSGWQTQWLSSGKRGQNQMKRARFASLFLLLLGLLLLLPLQSFGQAVYGSIFGTVADPTGAVIPNAKVTVTNTRKGTADTVTTDPSGNYTVSHLIPDTYQI